MICVIYDNDKKTYTFSFVLLSQAPLIDLLLIPELTWGWMQLNIRRVEANVPQFPDKMVHNIIAEHHFQAQYCLHPWCKCFSIYAVGNGSFHRNNDATVCDLLSYYYSLIQFDLYRPNWGLGGCAVHLHSAGQCTIFKFSVTYQDWHCFSLLFASFCAADLAPQTSSTVHHHLHYFHHHHHHQNRSQCPMHLPMSIEVLEILKWKKLLHAHLKTIDSFFRGRKISALSSFSIFVI